MKGIYIVGGYPHRTAFIDSFKTVAASGFDFIEIGIPFNDPVADGPVIAEAAQQTIARGITTKQILEDLISMRNIPIKKYVMTYANIVYSYGTKAFSDKLKQIIDGIILADVPNRMADMFYAHGFEIPIVPFATPETRDQDIEKFNRSKSEFIYFVGVRGITGAQADFTSPELIEKITQIKKYTDKKVIVGFGVKTREDAQQAMRISDGFVVGTEAVKRQGTSEFKEYLMRLV